MPGTWGIPGTIRAPFAFFRILFPCFCEGSVHRDKKYRFKRLFLQNNPFNRDLIFLFIGLLLALFLRCIL